ANNFYVSGRITHYIGLDHCILSYSIKLDIFLQHKFLLRDKLNSNNENLIVKNTLLLPIV
ncbi:MAG: hypothetical protein QHH74_15750, partial [Spirochaetota bacterium]|nr:hypothetical protein [Spirochaetota bacterium]